MVGYSTQSRSQAGLERSKNDYLTASNSHLSTVLRRTLDSLKAETVTGNNLQLTIDSKAQQAALDALGKNCGAAVAIEPSTGKVLVMASSPSYDPNLVERHFGAIARRAQGYNCSPAAPLVNRATDGLYTPGSTFKVLTAAAALDSGTYTPDSTFDDNGYCIEYGKKVSNFADQSGPEVFGHVNFTTALEHSINAVFCEIGKKLGPLKVLEYARRFGFYSDPPLETPSSERKASGLYDHGRLFLPHDPNEVDPGRLAFGQERMQVTPLQMAMLAAGIANGGTVMRPYVDRADHDAEGRDGDAHAPGEALAGGLAGDRRRADEDDGGGRPVGHGHGRADLGRAGGGQDRNRGDRRERGQHHVVHRVRARERPKVAVAVFLENQHGTGGHTAAPIAKTIMEALLRRRP